MSDKNMGILLAGIGIFLMGISMLIFSLKAYNSHQQNNEVLKDVSADELTANAIKALQSPEFQKHLEKALSDAEMKIISIETKTVK